MALSANASSKFLRASVQFSTQPPGGSQQKVRDQELLRIANALGQAEKLFAELQRACRFGRPQGEVSHDCQRRGAFGTVVERRVLGQLVDSLQQRDPLRRPEAPREGQAVTQWPTAVQA